MIGGETIKTKEKLSTKLNLSNFQSDNLNLLIILLQTGYVTAKLQDPSQNEYLMRIPNNEVKIHMFTQYHRILIEKEFKISYDFNSFTKIATSSLLEMKKYKKNIQKLILDKLTDQGEKNESFFHGLVNTLNAFACIENPRHSTHESFSEMIKKNNKRIDGYFIPLKGKSKTAVIHEYKFTDSPNTAKKTLEEALWQIFINAYLSEPIRNRLHSKFSHIKKVIVRGLVFIEYKLINCWKVKMKQYKLKISQARYIVNFFRRYHSTSADDLLNKCKEQSLGSLIRRLKTESDKKKALTEEEVEVQPKEEVIIQKKRKERSNPKVKAPKKRKAISKSQK